MKFGRFPDFDISILENIGFQRCIVYISRNACHLQDNPHLAMDKMTPEQRRKNMQAIKAEGSVIEVKLAKALWRNGFRYRKNDKTVFGKPDMTFRKLKIAVFVDSEFWHGKDWAQRKHDHKSNQDFWYNKIEKNILRDKTVNTNLSNAGWIVIRLWGKEIDKNIAYCVLKIEKAIKLRKQYAIHKNSQ